MTAATTAIPVPTTHLTRRSPNSHLLIRPFIRREAVLSSRIEGTQSTLTDLLAAEAGARVARDSADLQEVTNYARALDYSVKQLETLPLSLRLKHAQFEAIHPFRDGNGRSVAWRRHSCSSRRRGRSTTHGCSGRPRIRNGETVLRCEYGRRSDGRERGSGRDRRYEAIIKSIVGTGIGLATLLLTLAGLLIQQNANVNARFDDVNARFDDVNANVNARFDDVNARIDDLQEDVRELRALIIDAIKGADPAD